MKNTILFFTVLLMGYLAEAQELQTYIKTAISNNPDIKASVLGYEIAREKTNEASTLANTQFGAGYFVSEPETRTGPQRFKLSVSQMLPWFGTITARENYSSALAEQAYVDLTIAKRKLILSVAQSYYELFATKAKKEVVLDQLQLLEQYLQIALTGVEVGKTSAVKVLQLQIRQNELKQEAEIYQQKFKGLQRSFNALLNVDINTIVEVPDALGIPKASEEIQTDSLALHPEILKYDALYYAVTQSELLNQKSSGPNIGLGLDYVNVAENPDMDMAENGKDVLMPMLTLSIPIFNKSIGSKTKQNKLQQQLILEEKVAKVNQLQSLLSMAVQNRASARISYETQLKNLVQAKNAEEILIKNYETESINFNDLLDILELELSIEIQKIEAEKNYFMQSASINYITNQ